jgi:hypothetical protein
MTPEQYLQLQQQINTLNWEQRRLTDMIYHQTSLTLRAEHPNPLVRYGARAFSQNQEDGITLEILRRMGIEQGTYIEFGVGNGLENNTLVLASLGWRGFWVGGENLAWQPKSTKLWQYYQTWINRPNIMSIVNQGTKDLNISQPDVISIDLDGVDIYLVEEMLQHNILPRVWLVEYNAHFPPPVPFKVLYNDGHSWTGDDYMGSSLQSYVDMMKLYGYELICCDAEAGANAWFVRSEELGLFPEIPKDIKDIYTPPRFFGHNQLIRHARSTRVVMEVLAQS